MITATTTVPSDVVAISALGILVASWKSSTLELERPCNAGFGISLEVGAWQPQREGLVFVFQKGFLPFLKGTYTGKSGADSDTWRKGQFHVIYA